MAIRNLFQTITIHPTLILFLIIAILTGTFIQIAIIWTIIIFHELGHILAATYYRWRIQSIVLWIFGGVMKTDEHTSRPLKEDIIVTLLGPLQHLWIYVAIKGFAYYQLLPQEIIEQALFFNTIILLFNSLPIYPLDGGKILLFLLSCIMPYRSAYRKIIMTSSVFCIAIIIGQLFVKNFTLTAVFLFLFLFVELYKYWRDEYYTFIRFLLNRMHANQSYSRIHKLYVNESDTLLEVFNRFKRNKYHHIYIRHGGMITETEGLNHYFHGKNFRSKIGDLLYPK